MNDEKQKNLDYDIFEHQWKKRHKASLPRRASVSSFSTIFWIGFWVIVAIGAAVFSGAHTIPAAEMTIPSSVPYREVLALNAFVIVEFVIFGSAAKRHENKWFTILLVASLFVAFIGNTSSSIHAVTEHGGDWLNQVGGVLLSVIAPVTALAAGEVLHLQMKQLSIKRAAAEAVFQEQWKEVEAKINTAYTKAVKEQNKLVNSVNFTDFTENTKRNRVSPKMEMAIKWLEEHPEYLETESRELANLIGVSHTLANGARKAVLASRNGIDHDPIQ